MRNLYKSRLVLLVCWAIISTGCKKITDINTDPTQSTNMDPVRQVSQVQLRFSGELTVNERVGIILTMPLVQQIGGIWANRYGQMYIENKQYMYDLWEFTYPNDVLNIVDAVNRTDGDVTKTNLHAIARIMKVYVFARLTDLYGDIPYSDAGKAFSNGTVRPKYDTQKDIYTDFFKELTEAAAALDPSRDAITDDLFSYNGNILQWKKFANSLHLRLAMRLVKVDPEWAKKEVQAAFQAGVFTSVNDICMLSHMDIQNSYADIRGNSVSVALNQQEVLPRANNTLIDVMKGTNDPRLNVLIRCYQDKPYQPFSRVDITDQVKAQVGITGVNRGSYIWDDWANSFAITIPAVGPYTVSNNEQKAQLANFLVRNNAPFFHLTYAETEFLLAEANMRWGLTLGGSVNEHYANGITAAFKQLSFFPGGPVLDNDVAGFIAGNPLQPGKEIDQINTQLWLALLLNGPEAYANWRRTGFPRLTPALTTESTTTTIPRRFEYPLSEHEQNANNIAGAIQALGGKDDWTGRVWWDKE